MESIKKYIQGYMSGDSWEELCVKCYRIRYQKDNYMLIPATQGGDAGIEGFTQNGIVHQCYCPEREYSDNELYDHLRNKLTADIDKLKNNAKRFEKLDVPPVTEWQFDIPEYRDSRIIEHAEKKRQEILEAKKQNSTAYQHIADNFRIVIKTAEDFFPEISRIVRTNLSDDKLNLAIESSDEVDWSKCDSEKIENIQKKIKAIMHVEEDDEDLNAVVGLYANYYMSGIEILNKLHVDFPEIYNEIYRIEQSYKKEVALKTRMNTDRSMNKVLFDTIIEDFDSKLRRDFSFRFTEASIADLKEALIASWLADCSMKFKE